LKVNNLDLSDPIAIYQQFLTDEVLDIIVTETNRYTSQFIQSHQLCPHSLTRNWKDTNRGEIKNLLAILMIMGINQLPKMSLYLSNSEMYSNPLIKKTMKHDRFDILLKCLHFSDNNDPATNQDRLSKIKNIVGLICNQFQ
jgi:hypothetical protein